MLLEVGTRLGRYELRDLLGAGGMGEVYRAYDSKLDRDVAIKVLPIKVSGSSSMLERFEREAQAVAALEHPNILAIHDFGIDDAGDHPRAWAAMELLHGATLRERLSEGPLPPRKAVDLARQLAEALGAAHDAGIVHRDVKPENVFVNDSGQLKVLDFGLAGGLAGDGPLVPSGGDTTAPTRTKLTDPGTVMGTVGYMSPEQVRGELVDHRSDIFSFGCVFYEMLTGQRAFERDTRADTMTAVLRDEPPEFESATGTIPPELERLVWRSLEKNPAERFHSASDLAFALGSLTTRPSSGGAAAIWTDSPQRSSPQKPRLVFAGLAIALIAAVLGGVLGRMIASSTGVGADALTTALSGRLQPLTFEPPGARQPSISPDGETVVYVRTDVGEDGQGDDNIYLHRVGGENPINLTPGSPEDDMHPAFSPDGRWIAFRSERDGGGIFVMGATGESVRRIADFGYNPAWSPDGKELVVATERIDNPFDRQTMSQLWRLDVAAGASTLITEGDAVQPDWSPNGQRIAFWGLPTDSGRRMVQTVPAAGGDHTVLVDDEFFNWSPRWSPDGSAIVFVSDRNGAMNVWRLPLDETVGSASGPAIPLTLGEQLHGFVSVASDGTLACAVHHIEVSVRRAPFDLATLAVGEAELVLQTSRRTHLTDVSPMGERIVVRINDGQEDLMIMRSDGTERVRVTNDLFRDRNGSFGPDGEFVYFDSDRSGAYSIWRIRTDGSGLSEVYAGPELGVPRLSPDGRWLVGFGYDRAGIVDLERPLEERVAEWIPDLDGRALSYPRWSPDGAKLVGQSQTRTEVGGILVYTLATGEIELVSDTGRLPSFLPDGRIFYLDEGALVLDLETGAVTPVHLGALADSTEVRVGGDGRSLWGTNEAVSSDVWILHP